TAGNPAQENSCVFSRFGQRADVVERRSECYQTVTGYSAISRHEPDYAAERCRLADGTARVRAPPGDGGASGSASAPHPSVAPAVPAAPAAADPPLEPPGTRDLSRGLRTGP